MINIRLNNILYLTLSIVGPRQTYNCVNEQDPSDAMKNTISEI